MKDNKYIHRFVASVTLCACAYYGACAAADLVSAASEDAQRPMLYLTNGDAIDPATAPVTTKFDENTARAFVAEIFGDSEEAPDLNEFLSRFTCASCGKRCLLASPSCFVGNGKQDSAVEIYQEMYPEVELFAIGEEYISLL